MLALISSGLSFQAGVSMKAPTSPARSVSFMDATALKQVRH